jgi:hypothetical protein
MSTLRALAQKLRIGELALRYFHRPLGLLKHMIDEGGPFEQRRTEAGRLAMIEAAGRLPAMNDPGNPLPIACTYLSGEKYWYQTLFCAVSLQQHVDRRVEVVVFDDGSFTAATQDKMRRVLPWIRFVNDNEVRSALDRHLPEAQFPSLRRRRLEYPHLRKLTDLHCAAGGWTMVLDSDMLFFRRPDALIDWVESPDRPIFMQDVATAYGYSPALMTELAGRRVPGRINVGLYTLDGKTIDWTRVEAWCAAQLRREGAHYLQEQALVALQLAQLDPIALSDTDYVVKPNVAEGRDPQSILHHYVLNSKSSYYQHCWPLVAERAEQRRGQE